MRYSPLAAAALFACAVGAGACVHDVGTHPVPSLQSQVSQAAASAHIVCADDEIRLDTPVVRAQRDGVHFMFENQGGWWGAELHHQTWADGTAEGIARFHDETTSATSAIAPGEVTVACVPASGSGYADPGAMRTTLTIVDPLGLYVPWDLVCGFGTQFRVTIRAGRDADPEKTYQQVQGVRASDEFKQPKYPESAQYSATDRVLLRDGAVIARFFGGGGVGGEWDLIVNACPGTGVGGA